MRIAQVCPRYFPYRGGIEQHVKAISEGLLSLGHEVEVLSTDPGGKYDLEEMINGVKIRRFKSWAPNEAYFVSEALRKYLKGGKDNYDIIHAHSYHAIPALYAFLSKSSHGKTVFTPHYHGSGHTFVRNILHLPYAWIGKKLFLNADQVICVSEYEKSIVRQKFAISSRKIEVIPNGIFVDLIRQASPFFLSNK